MSPTQQAARPGRVSSALARDRLGVPAVLSFVLAGVAPLTVAAGVLPTAYATTGLTGIPAAFVVIAVILALFALGYVAMARAIRNAGPRCVEVPYAQDYHRRKVLPEELDARVIAAWRQSGISAPLFRKTSCGVSAAHQIADYNGHWGVRELCDICPVRQADLCRASHRQPTPGDLDDVLAGLGYATEYLIDDGHIWTHSLGEQKRYAIQHILRYQIWELDQPHLLHAHGRSPTGYQPSASDRRLAGIRAQFTHAARFDEDN